MRPSPQSYNNSEQQSKRYKANTTTANSEASAIKQTEQHPQPAFPLCNTPPRSQALFEGGPGRKGSDKHHIGGIFLRHGRCVVYPTRIPPDHPWAELLLEVAS